MRIQKKITAAILVLIMLVSFLSMSVLAADNTFPTEHNLIGCSVCGGAGIVIEEADSEDPEAEDREIDCENCESGKVACDGEFKDGRCSICGAISYILAQVEITMPDGQKYIYNGQYAVNAGAQTLNFLEVIDSLGLTWQNNYYISSSNVVAPNTLIYTGESKFYELVSGVSFTIEDTNMLTAQIIVSKDSKMAYYIFGYHEQVDGTFNDPTPTQYSYTAVDIGTNTGFGPVIGSDYSVIPPVEEGFLNNIYNPAIYVYWNGLLNSGNYDNTFVSGKVGYYPLSSAEALHLKIGEGGTMSGTAYRMESNFMPTFMYYYALIRPVIYDANGGNGTMNNQDYLKGQDVTVAENGFTRNGYTFEGWNTAADGSGTSYVPEDTFKMGAVENVTLYAQWIKNAPTPGEDPKPTPDPRPDPKPDPTPTPAPEPDPTPEPTPEPSDDPVVPPVDDNPPDEPPSGDEVIVVPPEDLGDLPQTGTVIDDVPQTGDDFPVALIFSIMVASAFGLFLLLFIPYIKKKTQE